MFELKVIAGILVLIYLGCGALMGVYEKSQTDDDFRYSSLVLWLPRMFGKCR